MTVLRSLRRSVAHHRMKLAGYVHVNKNPKIARRDAFGRQYYTKDGSMFSHKWMEYLKMTKQPAVASSKKKGHKAA